MPTHEQNVAVQKTIWWQQAKAALRTVVALQGSFYGAHADQEKLWEESGKAVEQFIRDFEFDGLHE